MRTIFVGAVEGSARALRALCAADHRPAMVVTLPPDRADAHSDFVDLGPLAQANGIPVHRTPRSDARATLEAIRALAPDLIVVIGWSQLVGPAFRALPRIGVLGFHPSALPRMRGRGVIPWHILTGQRQGGATLFWIDEGTDSGPIADQRVFGIDADRITARDLYDQSVAAMVSMLPALMDRLTTGEVPSTAQDESRASVCARRRPEDGEIDWTRPAAEIERLIRAVGPPYPGATTGHVRGVLTVISARLHGRDGYHIGLPGQVQDIRGQVLTVMCGDGRCLDLLEWVGPPPARHACFKRMGHGSA